jgi:hypothetical protein
LMSSHFHQNAPPMITTSYSESIATQKMAFASRKRNQFP